MSKLPDLPLLTGSVTLRGTEVPIRALSRLEVLKLRTFEDREDEAEPFVVAAATGVTEDEARAWLGSVGTAEGGALVEGILQLSRLADPSAGSTGEGPTERSSSEP